MNKRRIKRLLALVLALCLTLPLGRLTAQAEDAVQITQLPIEQLEDVSMNLLNQDFLVEEPEPEYLDTDEVRVSIVLEKPGAVEAGYAPAAAGSYRDTLAADQAAVTQRINQTLESDLNVVWNLTLAANLISANVPYGQIEAIEAVPGVRAVYVERQYQPAVLPESGDVAYPTMVSAGEMTGVAGGWAEGYTGAGSRIAIIDTGIDSDHQSFDAGAFQYALEQNAKAKEMTPEAYVKSLNLLTARDVAMVLGHLNMKERMPEGATADDLYLSEKLPFAFNYIDQSLEITHDKDSQGGHGSHVAGIASANRYLPKDDGYVEYTQDAGVVGTAPDAQLLIMKVFGRQGGAYDTDYMAAIEDAIMLGCDTINLSLGSTISGYTYSEETYFNQIFKNLESTGVVVTISAGNSSSFATNSTSPTGLLYADDINDNRVGMPGAFTNSLAVASVDNISVTNIGATFGEVLVAVQESSGGRNASWISLDTTPDSTGTQYSYLFLGEPANPDDTTKYGVEASDYADIEVEGKIVLVSRGNSSFADKLSLATQMGAAALVIYNNVPGAFGASVADSSGTIPCVTISQKQMQTILAQGNTGTATVTKKAITEYLDENYYTMSDFSSWGVPEDLSLKPEITAPGGNIYSVDGEYTETDRYTTMSGTSMAAPHLAGLSASLMQYIRENHMTQHTGLSARVLAQSLLMSTAEPVIEEKTELPYSVRKQGAGLANVSKAILSPTYVLVEGQPDGKVKFELGDDPERNGSYTLKFHISNMTDQAQSYLLDTQILTPAVLEQDGVQYRDHAMYALAPTVTYAFESPLDFDGNGLLDQDDAQALMAHVIRGEAVQNQDQADLNGDGQVNEYDVHLLLLELQRNSLTVPAQSSVTVTAQVTLSESDRQYMEEHFVNGTYVEGFLYLNAQEEADGAIGVSHSIPILGFYGNWTDGSMFERSTGAESTDSSMFYSGNPSSNFMTQRKGNSLHYLGGNPYGVADEEYLEERNAINPLTSYLSSVRPSLIRNAAAVRVEWGVSDSWEDTPTFNLAVTEEMLPAEFYYAAAGAWQYTTHILDVSEVGQQISAAGDNGKVYTIRTTAAPEYYRDETGEIHWEDLGAGQSWSCRFTTDTQTPELQNMYMETDMITGQKTLYVTVRDNRYTAYIGVGDLDTGTLLASTTPNQTEQGAEVTVALDVTNVKGTNVALVVADYAMNESYYELPDVFEHPEPLYFRGVASGRTFQSFDETGIQLEGSVDLDKQLISAAEYVNGYIYYIVSGYTIYESRGKSKLYVCPSGNCKKSVFIKTLDYGMYNSLSYNVTDNKLYGVIDSASQYEGHSVSELATIDLYTGKEELVATLSRDLFAMCIDDTGKFYGISPKINIYVSFRLEDAVDGYIVCNNIGSGLLRQPNGMPIFAQYSQDMCYDHNTGKIYWACFAPVAMGYPGIGSHLMELAPDNNTWEIVIPNIANYTALYIVPGTNEDTPTSIGLSQTELTLALTETFQLTAFVYPWTVTDRTVSWASSDETVATVSPDGTVTALAEGTCTITATSNRNPDLSASCTVTVTP